MNALSKKILLAVVPLVIITAAGGYFVFIPQQEKKHEQRIAALIASLPGNLGADSITVHALGKSAEIRGLRGATRYFGSDVNLDVALLTLSGLNFTPGKGVDKLADSLIISGLAITETANPPQPQAMTQDIALKNLELHDLRGDFNAVAELFGEASLARKMDILATFSIGSSRMRDYTVTMHTVLGPIVMSLDSSETQEASLLTAKNSVSKNLRLTSLDTEIIGLDRLSAASMKVPNILAPMFELMETEDFDAAGELILEKFRKEALEVRGLALEGLRFQLMMPEPVSVSTLKLDLMASADRLAVKKEVQGLSLPPAIYGPMSLEAAQFSEFYEKPLDLDLRKDIVLTHTSGAPISISINDLFIRDKNLASAQFKGELLYRDDEAKHMFAVFDSDPDDLLLKNAVLTLTDKALVATFLEAEFGDKAADMREMMAQGLVAMSALGGESFILIAEGLAKLIRAPGTLTITGAPELPVSLADPLDVMMKALRLTVEYTPAK